MPNSFTCFCLFLLSIFLTYSCSKPHMAARTVATYESISIAWSPLAGRPDRICKVSYREAGSADWRQGYPLWFDDRDWEYRGSLVELASGTTYEFQLEIEDTEVSYSSQATTWTDPVPIGDTVWVSSRNKPLIVRKGGNPDGYLLYMPRPGDRAVIDVEKHYELCVKIKKPYVVIRGLTLRGATDHGIRINPRQHHIVIEQCDIADWGSPEPGYEEFGRMFDSGIFADGDGFHPYHLVIQDNKIHHPSYGANYPGQLGAKTKGSRGPQAITLMRSGGVYVIRYNAIYSDSTHYFKDGMGEWRNFSFEGFPFRESDIHHNYISHCRDDAIEAEGGNQNVRIWANYTTRCAHHISTANTNLGPAYIWRNISGLTESKPGKYDSVWGRFLATDQPDPSGEKPRGQIFFFHNSLTQPDQYGRPTKALRPAFPDLVLEKNNHLQGSLASQKELMPRDTSFHFPILEGIEVDRGEFLPGFNDDFVGKAPDVGALEAGGKGMLFGPRR